MEPVSYCRNLILDNLVAQAHHSTDDNDMLSSEYMGISCEVSPRPSLLLHDLDRVNHLCVLQR